LGDILFLVIVSNEADIRKVRRCNIFYNMGIELNNKEEKMRRAYNRQPRIKRMLKVGFLELIIASFVLIGVLSGQAQAAIPTIEREALIALYNSTDGDNWVDNSGWKTPPLHTDGFAMPGTECSWDYMACDFGNTTIQFIWLDDNQLSGSIPPELGNLTNLQWIDFSGNELTGPIPRELGSLVNLRDLALDENQLTGSIPPELGNLVNLQDLYLSHNQLTGSIPTQLGNLANLQELGLSSNQLDGSIPPELGNLANLQELEISSNQLTGRIPPELGNLSNLQDLHLSSNQLTGSIPVELMNMINLSSLDICDNHLYTSNSALRDFLNNLQPGWESCQKRAMPWIMLLLND